MVYSRNRSTPSRKVSDDSSSPLVNILLVFVFVVVGLAFVAPQFIPLASSVFVFVFVDHVEGLVAGAIVFGLLGSLASKEVKVGGLTLSVGAILGVMGQYSF